MSSLIKFGRIITPLVSKNTGSFYNVTRPKTHLHADWMPGPYPKTEEERKKAAKKYGLSPEEYEPYPDDGYGVGDYPKLPFIGRAARDPYYPWDDPTHRRNIHEPLHKHEHIIGEDRYDAGIKPLVNAKQVYGMFFGIVGGLLFVIWLFEDFRTYPAVMEKQLPKPGAVHYTFEPVH